MVYDKLILLGCQFHFGYRCFCRMFIAKRDSLVRVEGLTMTPDPPLAGQAFALELPAIASECQLSSFR